MYSDNMEKIKLSAIIFSRNDIDDALLLIKDIYNICDEIVIIDQSDYKKHRILINKKNKNRLSKLKIFYSIALGDPAPLRMWGLNKCRGEWIILLDTDERLNQKMKNNIKTIIKTNKYNAFAIRRNEYFMQKKQNSKGFTYQVRLYKKNKTYYKGLTHEFPIINGKIGKLEKKYFINHYINYTKRPREYGKLNKFQFRMNYKTMNYEIIDNLYKFLLLQRNNHIIKIINFIIICYEKIGLKKQNQELSNIDYFIFNYIKSIGFSKRINNKMNIIPNFKANINLLKRINKWRNEEDAEENFEISKIINSIGLIKFLNFDKDSTIKNLIKKYKNKEHGIDLLIYLLKQEIRRVNKHK